jgi:multidrug transporter EmrE-like cation transporter
MSLFVILLLSVLMNTVAQLCLKHGMKTLDRTGMRNAQFPASLVGLLSNPFIAAWVVLLVPSMILWLKALSMTDLSLAYPFQSLTLVFISLGSIVFLDERVTVRQWTGIALILLGIFFTFGT